MPPSWMVRVSQVDAFRDYLESEDMEIDAFLGGLVDSKPNEAMLRGSAFHRALEISNDADNEVLSADGYHFIFDGDFELELPRIREVRASKNYGGIIVSGKTDSICGNLMIDHKSTSRFDAERYYQKYQWRFYLDIFKADRFRWNIFEMDEIGPYVYRIRDLHILEQCRYPDLEKDCAAMAGQMRRFLEHASEERYIPRVLFQETQEAA